LSEMLIVKPDDPIIARLNFKPYRNIMVRRVVPFLPGAGEPQTKDVKAPWGAVLTAKMGDMLISELDAPADVWPVDSGIFDETYMITEPGICIKRAITLIVPLTDLTNGNVDGLVTVHTLEGPLTVRAGDFMLAKGVRGEIWPIQKEKFEKSMRPA